MNIDEMPAGREMDCLIAEKVFGWGKDTIKNVKRNRGYYNCKILELYSTGIADAWVIVRRWVADYGTFELNCANINTEINWHCQFGNYPAGDGKTAPLAICRAALKAAGIEHGPQE